MILRALSFLLLASSAFALTFQIEPKTTLCVYEDIDSDSLGSMDASWEVVRGGLLDVNIKFTGPDGYEYMNELFFEGRGTPGYLTFDARVSGRYSFCFDNEMSRWTPKVVSFSLNKEHGKGDKVSPGDIALMDHVTPLQKSISKISNGLSKIESEQSYYRKREHRHRNTAESTNSRVQYWSIGETIVLIGVSLSQVFILRRWFDQRQGSGV